MNKRHKAYKTHSFVFSTAATRPTGENRIIHTNNGPILASVEPLESYHNISEMTEIGYIEESTNE